MPYLSDYSMSENPAEAPNADDYLLDWRDYSISENPAEVYSDGRKPLSRISKKDLAEAGFQHPVGFARWLAKDAKVWKPSEWHHSSKEYNTTDFYDPYDLALALRARNVDELLDRYKGHRTERIRAVNALASELSRHRDCARCTNDRLVLDHVPVSNLGNPDTSPKMVAKDSDRQKQPRSNTAGSSGQSGAKSDRDNVKPTVVGCLPWIVIAMVILAILVGDLIGVWDEPDSSGCGGDIERCVREHRERQWQLREEQRIDRWLQGRD